MASLPTRFIGTDAVTAIGFGMMGLSAFYKSSTGQGATDEDRLKFLDDVYARGETHWDSADMYGDSELLLGKWFKRTGKRADIFLVTKFGLAHGIPGRVSRADPAYVREAFNKSIARLGVEHVDLYYLHRADPTVPIEHTVRAMAELVAEGKVRYLGLSEVSAATLRRAHAVHPIAAVQLEYSPFELAIEDPQIALLKTARELGVAVVAYSPLGRGLLTGAFTSPDDFEEGDLRRLFPRFSTENFPNILKITECLKRVGARHGATSGQTALAWLLAQGADIIPIPGTTKVKYLDENLGALSVTLTAEEVDEIRRASIAAGATEAPRLPPAGLQVMYADTPKLEDD